MRFPSLKELLKDPLGSTANLTTPQLAELVSELKELIRSQIPREAKYESPAEMALALGRGAWQTAPHLELLNEKVVGLIDGKLLDADGAPVEILVIEMPPRHGKSEFCSKWTPTWFLHKFPKGRVILTSYEFSFAEKWGRDVRDLVLDLHEELGIKLNRNTTSASDWTLQSKGGMKTAGAGSAIIGRGADLFIIDDPHASPEEARSLEMQQKMWDWFETVAKTRREPGAKMILIGTRWHETDLIGRVLQAGKDKKLKVAELRLPALAEENDPLGRDVDDPLWPDRWSKEYLLGIQNADSGYNWSAVYQQHPSPEEGTEILRAWWSKYVIPPAQFDEVIQSWDFTFKKAKKSDYVVGQIWGRVGASFYLLYQIRGRMGMVESLAAFRNTTGYSSKITMLPTVKLIEDKANGPAIVDTVRHEVEGVVAWPPPGTKQMSKSERVAAVAPLIKAGNIFLPENESWTLGFIEEFAAFPNGSNDDQVDATTQALLYLRGGAWYEVWKQQKNLSRPVQPKTTEEMFEVDIHRAIQKKLGDGVKRLQGEQRPHQPVRRVRAW